MKLNTYQRRAMETALPTALHNGYLLPALIAEVGEVFDKLAKARRDGWERERLVEGLTLEWGDCAWPTAVALHLSAPGRKEESGLIQWKPFTDSDAALAALSDCSSAAFGAHSEEGRIRELLNVWNVLKFGCEIVTSVSFEDVLARNVDKLASRQARGTLTGSGDHR